MTPPVAGRGQIIAVTNRVERYDLKSLMHRHYFCIANRRLVSAQHRRENQSVTKATIAHEDMPGSSITEPQLVDAIKQRDLKLHFQPIMDLRTGKLRGLEALARVANPALGVIAAENFVPLAEKLGVISAIDDWVILEACEQLAAWQVTGLMPPGLDLAVNISGSEADGTTLGRRIENALSSSGADPVSLIVEITESEHSGQEASARSVQELHDLGVRVALDDFGIGHATFSRLRSLDFDVVKIDRLVISLITSNLAQGFVRIIVNKCRDDGAIIIAEGVETAEQANLATQLECDLAQGYFWSPAVTAPEAELLLAAAVSPKAS
jgi:EAL domain-containing protein (putative c-di-GMP-specific phosphodiesterase class I)